MSGRDRSPRARARLVVAVLLLVGLAVLTVAVTAIGARLGGNEGQDARIDAVLQEVSPVPDDAADLVDWGRDDWRRDRQLEPVTRVQVGAAYLRAWAAISRWQTSGDRAAVDDTFTGQAEDAVTGLTPDPDLVLTDLQHRLTLTFYSLDGATVAFSDEAEVVRGVGRAPEDTYVVTRESADVVMELEDGYWRVAQLRRLDAGVGATVGAASGGEEGVLLDGELTRPVDPVPDAQEAASLRGTTYAPVDWLDPSGVAADAAADLPRVRDLGLDAVAVPLPAEIFSGGDTPVAAERSLAKLLDAAGAAGLGVELVCLDGLDDLGPTSWAQARAAVGRLAERYGDHPAVVLWDLVRAPASRTATSVAQRATLAVLLREAVRDEDGDTPVTVGWDLPADASDPGLAGLVDVVTGVLGPASLDEDLATVPEVRAAGEAAGRAVRLDVTGITSAGGRGLRPRSEAHQAWDVARVVGAAGADGGFTVARLADTPGSSDGLLREDGSARPAASQLSDPTATEPSRVGDLLRSTPVRLLGLVVVLVVLVGGWRVVRRRLRTGWGSRVRGRGQRRREPSAEDDD